MLTLATFAFTVAIGSSAYPPIRSAKQVRCRHTFQTTILLETTCTCRTGREMPRPCRSC
jgi:hypothetical protein